MDGQGGAGLGPGFNGNSCAQCHAQPAIGGSSPGTKSPQNPIPNPQVALATLNGATNKVPPFITADGPVREARFIMTITQSGAVQDGGVHDLFSIAGRTDAAGCTLAQPDFPKELGRRNVVFRIPTPVFGLGLVEVTPDSTLRTNLGANAAQKALLGIRGSFNASGNDGTITRFGWKAQNKSLLIFSGEAYNVEQGVSNEVFPSERSADGGCAFNPSPEDFAGGDAGESTADVLAFATFGACRRRPHRQIPRPRPRAARRYSTKWDAVSVTRPLLRRAHPATPACRTLLIIRTQILRFTIWGGALRIASRKEQPDRTSSAPRHSVGTWAAAFLSARRANV